MNHILRLLLIPLLLVVTACAIQTPSLGALPAPQPGTARIVLYRDVGYYDSSAVLTVSLNNQSTATVGRGDVVYRDIAPGTYTVTFKPTAYSPNQFKTVAIAAGDVVYVKLENFSPDNCGGVDGWSGGGCRAIAYTSVIIDPSVAQHEIRGLNLSQG
jgi:hypothetical protein